MSPKWFIVLLSILLIQSTPIILNTASESDIAPLDIQSYSYEQEVRGSLLSPQNAYFIENQGQLGRSDVLYYFQGPGTLFLLMEESTTFQFQSPSGIMEGYTVHYEQCNRVKLNGLGKEAHYLNFFLGSAPDTHFSKVKCYRQVRYSNLWDGIDLVFRFDTSGIKYDFIINPGVDSAQIRMRYEGMERIEIEEMSGDLLVNLRTITIRDSAPVSYQKYLNNNQKIGIGTRFLLMSENILFFDIEDYDTEKQLFIDPTISWSTYLGSSGANENGYKICIDSNNDVIITGVTYGYSFPTTGGAYCESADNIPYIYISKYSGDGSTLKFSTFLGYERSNTILGLPPFGGVAVDSKGAIYVTGATTSGRFPTTIGAYDKEHSGEDDVFISKIDASGTNLLFSTFLGGKETDIAHGIAVDDEGCAYIAGMTTGDFPTTQGAFNTSGGSIQDGFIAKLDKDGESLVYSTYIPGDSYDWVHDIDIDDAGRVYATGVTRSDDFPISQGAFDDTHSGGYDAFALKLSADGSDLLYSTFLGSILEDKGHGICVDDGGYAYIVGETTGGFPMTDVGHDTSHNGNSDVFVCKLSSDGKDLEASTYHGGGGNEKAFDVALDGSGNVHVTGWARDGFPTTEDAYDSSNNGLKDAFLLRFSSDLDDLLHATFIGGSEDDGGWSLVVDDVGDAYVTGFTHSSDMPMVGAVDGTFNGNDATYSDTFVLKYRGQRPPLFVDPGIIDAVEDVPLPVNLSDSISDPDEEDDELELTSTSPFVTDIDRLEVTFKFPNGVLDPMVKLAVTDGFFDTMVNLTFNVTPVNDPPVVEIPYENIAEEDVPLTLHLADYVTDVDNELLDLLASTESKYATVEGLDLTLLFPEGVLEHDLYLNVSDGNDTTEAHVHFTVTPVDDPPVVSGLGTVLAVEDFLLLLNLTPHISDVDTPLDELELRVEDGNATVDGLELHFLFRRGGFTRDVEVWVSDAANTVRFLVMVEVVETDDPPRIGVIPPQYLDEDEALTLDLSEYIRDEDTPLEDLYLECEHPAVTSISGLELRLLYTLETPDHVIHFNVSDNKSGVEGSFEVSVRSVNDPVVLHGIGDIEPPYDVEVYEGDLLQLPINASDEDNPVLDYQVVTTVDWISVDAYGFVNITPPRGVVREVFASLVIDDHNGSKETVQLLVRSLNANDPPERPVVVSPSDGSIFDEGESISFEVLVSDPDIEHGQVLNLTWTSNISGELAALTTDGLLSFATDELAVGVHLVTVEVSDGMESNSTSFQVVVKATPDGPEPNGNGGGDGGEENDGGFPVALFAIAAIFAVGLIAAVALWLRRKGS